MKILIVAALAASVAWCQLGDLNTYAIPAPPTLPAAGGTWIDPVFGTTFIRVTDESTNGGGYCYHDYAYYEALNRDSRRLTISCAGPNARYWFDFNPEAIILGSKHSFPNTPDGVQPTGDSVLQWSSLYAGKAIVLGITGRKIWELDVDSGVYTLLKTFSSGLPAGTTAISTTSIDRADNVFAILTYGGSGVTGCIAWKRSTDQILYMIETSNTHSCLISKNGRHFLIQYDSDPGDGRGIHIVDLENNNADTGLSNAGPNFGPIGHKDFTLLGIASFQPYWPSPYGAITYRLLSSLTSVLSLTGESDSDGHVSCRNDDNEWCTSERYRVGGDGIAPIQQEIVQYPVDGSLRVRRLGHHHSSPDVPGTDPYRSQPQGNASRDGRFVVINSTMGDPSNRVDVYIIVVSRKSNGMLGAW